jgi:Predicted membrane protein
MRVFRRFEDVLRLLVLPGFKGMPLYDVLAFFLKSFTKGRLIDRAASVAFNFFLAIFPLILVVFTLIPYIPIANFQNTLFDLLQRVIPVGTFDVVQQTIFDIINQGNSGLLSLSVLMAFVFGSSGISAIFNGFKNSYLDYGSYSWIKQRVNSFLLLFAIGLMIIVSIGLISFGDKAIRLLVAEKLVRHRFIMWILYFSRWLMTIFMVMVSMSLLYFFGDVEQKRFRLFTPGTILSTTLFIFATIGFNIYISNFSRYNALYGSIGTLIILLLWLWIVAIVILCGYDLNASINTVVKKVNPLRMLHYGRIRASKSEGDNENDQVQDK